MSSLVEKVHNLEQDIIQFKASQGIGSSSSQVIPVYEVDYSKSAVYYVGANIIIKFTAKDTINPILMPRLKTYVDGVEQTALGYNNSLFYDEFENALLIAQWTGSSYELPNEKTTTVHIQVLSNNLGTHTFRIAGTIYASCLGECKLYAENV